MTKQLLWVAFGGAIGSVLRYLVQKAVMLKYAPVFPWGTFIVNILGCFVIGLLWGWSLKSANFTDNLKLFLMTGLCGGFTTFSAFSLESISLLRDGKFSLFLAYSLGSLLLGLIVTFAAVKMFRVL